jgi:hypothetical protein
MRHVDEGTIHAWLDRQVADSQEAAWITTHLRECATCSARVAEEEATVRDAESLLASVAPAADGSRQAFEGLVAGAKKGAAQPSRRWMAPAGMAATIALAIALGWMARQMTSSGGPVPRAVAPTLAEHRAEVVTAPPDVVPSSTAASPGISQPRQQAATSLPRAGKTVDVPRPDGERASKTTVTGAEGGTGAGQAGAPLVAAAPPPLSPVVDPPPSAQQSAEPTPEVTPAVAQVPAVDGLSVSAPARVPRPSLPAALAGGLTGASGGRGGRGAGRGGGGGGAGVASGRGRAAGVGAGTGPTPGVSTPTDALSQGRLLVDGAVLAPRPSERVNGIEWFVLPRPEAAASSGMALYGIEGLMPARTMVSADGSKVRTVYVVNAAEIDLVQEKQSPSAPRATVQNLEAAPSLWSSVRGDVVLTLRAGADAVALGARVRLD